MLKRLFGEDTDSALSYLGEDAVSVRIRANLYCYRDNYSFAEFWAQYNDIGEITAVLSKINGACTLVFSRDADTEEIVSLLHFIGFNTLFLDKDKAGILSLSYSSCGDILVFDKDISTSYDTDSFTDMKIAFSMISENEGDGIAKLDYLEWLSDFTFKKNRGCARISAINEETLVSFAMTSAETEKSALISGVFTDKTKRKQGFGERALLSLCKSLIEENKKIYIMTAETKMTAYYEKRGFSRCGGWCEIKGE